MPGLAWRTSAATAAACGAAAEVPKKLGLPSASKSLPPKNVLLVPSTAAICGVLRDCAAIGVPVGEKTIVAPPFDVNDSGTARSEYRTAPTPCPFAAAECGTTVELLVPNSLGKMFPVP